MADVWSGSTISLHTNKRRDEGRKNSWSQRPDDELRNRRRGDERESEYHRLSKRDTEPVRGKSHLWIPRIPPRKRIPKCLGERNGTTNYIRQGKTRVREKGGSGLVEDRKISPFTVCWYQMYSLSQMYILWHECVWDLQHPENRARYGRDDRKRSENPQTESKHSHFDSMWLGYKVLDLFTKPCQWFKSKS